VNAIQAAAAEAFVEILRDAGVPVTIGGREYQAMVSQSGLAVDLEEGGFTQDGSLTVKLLVAHLPPLRARHLSDLGHTMVSRIYALFDYSTELPRRHF
jgi:hypothetical protein